VLPLLKHRSDASGDFNNERINGWRTLV
jgi:hypothetical protein